VGLLVRCGLWRGWCRPLGSECIGARNGKVLGTGAARYRRAAVRLTGGSGGDRVAVRGMEWERELRLMQHTTALSRGGGMKWGQDGCG
jgi:hypothetical protein